MQSPGSGTEIRRQGSNTPLRQILRFEAVDRISLEEMSRISPPVRGTAGLVAI